MVDVVQFPYINMAARRFPALFTRRSSFRFKRKEFLHVPTEQLLQRKVAPKSLVALSSGILSGFVAFELFSKFKTRPSLSCNEACFAASEESRGETENPEPRVMSRREKRFNQFASCEHEGQILMTAQDFLESLIENEPKCKDVFLF